MDMLFVNAKNPAFWQEVKTGSHYETWRDILLKYYETYTGTAIEEISFEAFMEFHRTGKRVSFEKAFNLRRTRMSVSAFLSLIYPEREEYLTDLQNTLWAICGEYCWALPNHTPDSAFRYNNNHIDICAAILGAELSQIRYLLAERLEPVLLDRIQKEVDKRIIRSYLENTFDWEKKSNNWAAVCAGNVAIVFIFERPDLFEAIKPRIDKTMECFLSGFKADGVCREGLGYWEYGFGHFVNYAEHLFAFTNGREDLFQNELVKKVAVFPETAYLGQGAIVSFADCDKSVRISKGIMGILQKHYGENILDLQESDLRGYLDLFGKGILSFEYYRAGSGKLRPMKEKEYYLPDSQIFVKKGSKYSFAAKGGDNQEPHNHNDVGTFIVSNGEGQLIADIGSGEYTKDYFINTMDKRYQILCNRSGGHSVPIINGIEQSYGAEYHGSMHYEKGKLELELSGAYPIKELTSLKRCFIFEPNRICLKDCFELETPGYIQERFVTMICPEEGKGYIKIGSLYMKYDDSIWSASITQETHISHSLKEQSVYLIDFVSILPEMKEFEMEMVF